MDKRYYSARHRRNSKRKHINYAAEQTAAKSTFILRLNICLGIAVIAVGIYKLNSDISFHMTDGITRVLSRSTSIDSIKSSAVSVFNFISEGRNIGFLANLGEDVALSDESLDYIAENENAYYNRQKALESP